MHRRSTIAGSVAKVTLALRVRVDSKVNMGSLTSIVAVGLDGAIGVRNELPWRLKSDLRFFQKMTKEQIVVMGRKTFESIGGCLPKRENIVLSHSAKLFAPHPGCVLSHTVEETLYLCGKAKKKSSFIIGGAQTYAQFAKFVDRYLVTVVKARFPEADAFFNEAIIGDDTNWIMKELEVERINEPGADEFEFQVFELVHRRPEEVAARRQTAIDEYRRKNHFLRREALRKSLRLGQKLEDVHRIA
jgi:dihydrofolate reductase